MYLSTPQNRDKTGRFLPGQSGNPGGRPVGLSGLIRESTNDGAELVEFMLKVFRGELDDSVRTRADAATWLADRAFGKPAQTANIGGDCERCASFDAEVPDPVEQLEEKLSSMRERMFPDLPPDQCACDPCYQAYKDSLVENSNSSTKSPDCVLIPIRSHLI